MERRKFLKFVGIGGAAAAAVPLIGKPEVGVDGTTPLTPETIREAVGELTLKGGYITDGNTSISFDGSQATTANAEANFKHYFYSKKAEGYGWVDFETYMKVHNA